MVVQTQAVSVHKFLYGNIWSYALFIPVGNCLLYTSPSPRDA